MQHPRRTLHAAFLAALVCAAATAGARTLADASTSASVHPVRESDDGETTYVRRPSRQAAVVALNAQLAAGAPAAAVRRVSTSPYAYNPDAVADSTHASVAALETSLNRAAGSVATAAAPLVDAAADAVTRATAGVTAAAARAAPSIQSFVKTAKESVNDLTDATAGGSAVTAQAAQSFAARTSAAAVGVAASLADGFVAGAAGPAAARGAYAAGPAKDLRSAVAAAVAGSVAAKDDSGPVLGAYAPAP